MTKVQHTDDDAALYRRIAEGDTRLRNEMAERHFGLVRSLAVYYAKRNPHLEMDDLLQEGRFGVVKALHKFDVDKGYRFSTYATYWIKHYIQRYVIANHSGGASTSKKDTEAYMTRDADGLPCTEAMSEVDRKLYERRCVANTSLSTRPASESGDGAAGYEEVVEDRDLIPVEEIAGASIEWSVIQRILFDESIEPKHRTVVCMRFGVMGYRKRTIQEVARELGIPPLRVTAIEQTTVMHISRLMEEEDGTDQALDSGGAEGEGSTAAHPRTTEAVHAEGDGERGSSSGAGVAGAGGATIPRAG